MIGYQVHHLRYIDTFIYESIESGNKHVNRYVDILNESYIEKEELKQKIIHLQSMYDASKSSNEMLRQQIDVVSHYWKKEYIKISDELFDIKNKGK